MSSTAAPLASPFTVEKRQKNAQGIDFPRAYRALIKGFIRAKTARELNTAMTKQEKQEG